MTHEWQQSGTAARETLLPIGAQVINACVDHQQTQMNQNMLSANLGTRGESLIYSPNQGITRRIGVDGVDDHRSRHDCINEGELAFRLKKGIDKNRGKQQDHVRVFSNLAGLASPFTPTDYPDLDEREELQQEWLKDNLQYIGLAVTPDSHADQQGKLNLHVGGPITQRLADSQNAVIGQWMCRYFPKNSELKQMHAWASNQTGERPIAILRGVDPETMDILSYAYFKDAATKILDIAEIGYNEIYAPPGGAVASADAERAAYAKAKAAFDVLCAKNSFNKLVLNHLAALASTFAVMGHYRRLMPAAGIAAADGNVDTQISDAKRRGGPWTSLLQTSHVPALRGTYRTPQVFVATHAALLASLRAFVARQMSELVGVCLTNARPKTTFEMQTRPFAW